MHSTLTGIPSWVCIFCLSAATFWVPHMLKPTPTKTSTETHRMEFEDI